MTQKENWSILWDCRAIGEELGELTQKQKELLRSMEVLLRLSNTESWRKILYKLKDDYENRKPN